MKGPVRIRRRIRTSPLGRTFRDRYLKRGVNLVISIVVALFTYAALDDITTGSETSQLLEWITVAAGSAWFGALAVTRWSRNLRSL